MKTIIKQAHLCQNNVVVKHHTHCESWLISRSICENHWCSSSSRFTATKDANLLCAKMSHFMIIKLVKEDALLA